LQFVGRYALFRVNAKHVGDHQYWKQFRAHLERKDVQRAFYEHCMAADLSVYDSCGGFQNSVVTTPFYRKMREGNLPPFIRFLGALVKQQGCVGVYKATSDSILGAFSRYLMLNGLNESNKVLSTVAMGMILSDFKAASSGKFKAGGNDTGRQRGWSIDIAMLKQELIDSNRYVENDQTAS
jgi:hypothetical protein